MTRPALEVADVFRDHGAAWRHANRGHVSLLQLKVMSAIESCRTVAGLATLPAGDVVLVVHSGTIRAALAIALDLAPDAALRFVIDPLSLTRIDRLTNGWRVVAVNKLGA
jgi:alpha-ribazole phosphatase